MGCNNCPLLRPAFSSDIKVALIFNGRRDCAIEESFKPAISTASKILGPIESLINEPDKFALAGNISLPSLRGVEPHLQSRF